MKWIDITDVLTNEGREAIKTGDVLFFDKIDLKVVRKAKGKVWAKRAYMYFPEEVEITDRAKMAEV